MSGTQDMIARILADAEAEGARIEEQARNKAGALLQEAGEQAEESKRRAAEEAPAVNAWLTGLGTAPLEQPVRAAELIRRNILLEKRRGLIADVLDGTVRALAALPDETYLPLLLRLSEAAARTGEGVLRLNARDLSRPGTAALSRDLGGGRSIRLSEEPAAIDGGVLLEYGELEMNSSFSALLEEKRERLEDLLNRELFG